MANSAELKTDLENLAEKGKAAYKSYQEVYELYVEIINKYPSCYAKQIRQVYQAIKLAIRL